MDINKYLMKQYGQTPCFDLVADIYVNEIGFVLPNYNPKGKSLKAITDAFRIVLHSEHGFKQIDKPQEHCVVLMSKFANQTPHHAGVYHQGKVLHALVTGNLYQDLHSLADQFKTIQYWALHEN